MALPAPIQRRNTARPHSIEDALVEQVNNLTATVRAFAAKLDGDDDGDSDYEASLVDEQVATAPRIIEPTP